MRTILILILTGTLFVSSSAMGNERSSLQDTIYILLKSDNIDHNRIDANPDSLSFSIYGFVRDNKPKDWLDSAGFLLLYVHLQKEPLQVFDVRSCRQYLEKRMISLYDLRDTLKNYVMVVKWRRESGIDDSPLLNRKTVILVTESNSKYYMRKVAYFMGFSRLTD